MDTPRYCPFYCEENIWHLAERAPEGALVLFVSNPARSVPMLYQRAARRPHEPLFWDYHVIMAAPARRGFVVWDLDTTLGVPVPARRYLTRSFELAHELPARFAPRFRVLEAATYRDTLVSDRRHMKTASGSSFPESAPPPPPMGGNPLGPPSPQVGYRAPPPPWPPIGRGTHNLERFVDMEAPFVGTVMDLDELGDRLLGISRTDSGAPHR